MLVLLDVLLFSRITNLINDCPPLQGEPGIGVRGEKGATGQKGDKGDRGHLGLPVRTSSILGFVW